jgi:tetratricopeptide (TPR) repeat protein
MGLLLLRRGQFARAAPYFRKAIVTLTARNPNPYDGEPYYNLGWSLLMQGKTNDAYEAFYKATWNDAWQHSGFQLLARLAARKHDYALALAHINKSLVRNYHSHTARHLKTVILRKLNKKDEALALITASMEIDRFNNGCLFESYLLNGQPTSLEKMKTLMRGNLNNYLELSLDYAHAGFYGEALAILNIYAEDTISLSPLVYYYMGWFAEQLNDEKQKTHYYMLATQQQPDGCFPNKIEEIVILQSAIKHNTADAIAYYALGNLWYDKRQYTEAISCWQQCVAADDRFVTAYRNLSLAFYNKLRETEKALTCLQKAFTLDTSDARVLMELDQLYKIIGKGFSERLGLLYQYPALVNERDDLYLEKITLLNNLGEYEKAKELLAARKFHPWEGGEGKVVGQFLLCHTELAKRAILAGRFKEAIELLKATKQYPENLGEGKLYGAQENDIYYLLGCACEGLSDHVKAKEYFTATTKGVSEPVQAIYYNDPQPDKIVYQALAWKKLGQPLKAEAIFKKFIEFGMQHIHDEIHIDYFAVSLPDMLVFDINLNQRNEVHCTYLQALGYLGIGNEQAGIRLLNDVLSKDINHQGAATNLKMIPFFT